MTREEFARAVTFDKLPSRLRQKIFQPQSGAAEGSHEGSGLDSPIAEVVAAFRIPAQGGRHGSTIFCGSTSRREREADRTFVFRRFVG